MFLSLLPRSEVISLSLKMIFPSVGFSKRMINLPVVDFPHPDSPTRPKVSPFLRASETSSTAFASPTFRLITPALIGKYFLMCCSSKIVSSEVVLDSFFSFCLVVSAIIVPPLFQDVSQDNMHHKEDNVHYVLRRYQPVVVLYVYNRQMLSYNDQQICTQFSACFEWRGQFPRLLRVPLHPDPYEGYCQEVLGCKDVLDF